MKLQKQYCSEAYLLSSSCRASLKSVIGLWHCLNDSNWCRVLWQLKLIGPFISQHTPQPYLWELGRYTRLLRRDIRGSRIKLARTKFGEILNSRKLAAKYRVKPFIFETEFFNKLNEK